MKELLTILAKNLVQKPEAVSVEEEQQENILVLKLRVDPEDMGKVIGKQGRIAKSIRSVVKAAAIHNNKKVTVEIVQ